MAISTINQNGLNAPLTLTAPVLTTPVISTITNGAATLTLPSSTGTLLSTANPQSGGVIQFVSATTVAFNTSSTSFVSTGLSATITPRFSTSKILIQVTWNPYQTSSNNEFNGALYKNGSSFYAYLFDGFANSSTLIYSATNSVVDSPATTSPITYEMYLKNGTANTVYTNGSGQNQRMMLWEIAA